MSEEDSTYRAVLIGCGRMGATIDDELYDAPIHTTPYSHAPGYEAAEGVELVAASDIDTDQLETARERYDIPRGYTDYREMIEEENPDIVSVATGPSTHEEMVCFAAENGAGAIFCEKPLARSMEEADRMVDVCRSNNVHFNLGVTRRFLPLYRKIREMIQDGVIGEPRAVIAQCGDGAVLHGHSHTADMMLFFSGDPDVDIVQAELDFDPDDVEDDYIPSDPSSSMGYVRFANGVRGYLTPGDSYEFEIDGEEGKIRTFNNGQTATLRIEDEEWPILEEEPFPEVEPRSHSVTSIEELVAALDGEGGTSAPIEVAAAGQEICMGWIASHLIDGSRKELPLSGSDRQLFVEK